MKRTIALEELSMNAWPSLRTHTYDGWILRFAEGYTRRANAVHPLYSSTENLSTKIARCEDHYRRERLRTIFKLTRVSNPSELDETLQRLGYVNEAPTSVQTQQLSRLPRLKTNSLVLRDSLSDEWTAAFCELDERASLHRSTLERILQSIRPKCCFAMLELKSHIIATGLAVAEQSYCGLFDIIVRPEYRRRGFGRQIVLGLLQWAAEQGAGHAYLQVMLDNEPALTLYSQLGFEEAYRYWYRVKE
jgi:ribosomal protein S18 acetylase RimI-like enzyme